MSLTDQDFFNIVWERAKVHKVAHDGENCRYRMPDEDLPGSDLCCFVGAAIPDKEYQERFDSTFMGVYGIQHNCPSLKNVDLSLMSLCQAIHDDESVSKWADRLREIAVARNLTIPE